MRTSDESDEKRGAQRGDKKLKNANTIITSAGKTTKRKKIGKKKKITTQPLGMEHITA